MCVTRRTVDAHGETLVYSMEARDKSYIGKYALITRLACA